MTVASQLGVPLVEGSDLLVRNGAVYMRSLGSLKRVDVVLRRVDAAWCDPLDLRTDSRLGVAGLVEAVARGTVSVVNSLGSGVLENPALHTVADALAAALLDEELLLRPSTPGGRVSRRAPRRSRCASGTSSWTTYGPGNTSSVPTWPPTPATPCAHGSTPSRGNGSGGRHRRSR